RRHTRLVSDWSSDVCSSDLEQHYAVSGALEMFGQHQAGPRVREAAKYLGLSQRRFIQVFKAEVGMTPKLFSRIQRFQQTRTFIRSEERRVGKECRARWEEDQ